MPSDPSAGHSSPFASRSRERRRCLRSAVILGIALLLPSGTVAASSAFASTTARNAGSGTTLKKCSSSAVSAAVAKGGVINVKCSGTIKLTHTLTITKKQNVTLNATHEKFTLTFPPSASAKFGTMHHVFLVSGGKLSLISVGIEDTQSNTATTQDGKDGRGGAGGTTPSSPGSNGKSGANGQSATNAKSVTGGCMVIQKGSVVSITNSNISGCVAEAGWGGWGGQGGSAGAGGTGATGRDGTESDPNGGRGGNGGNAGARGGNGGKAGNGGSAFGGAIYNRGKLTLSGDTFTKDSAIAGGGGNGGLAGWAGFGGAGGPGGSGWPPPFSGSVAGTGGRGGNGGFGGGVAGNGGAGGKGGAA